jgi:hypothetical protein
MAIDDIPIVRRLFVRYAPLKEDRTFAERAQTQQKDGIEVTVAVLDAPESRRFFGVPMARRGIQPVWLRIVNRSDEPYRLNLLGIDPNYYSPLEAAAANHFSSGKRILGFGLLAWWIFPFLILLPFKVIGAWLANRQIDAYFQEHAFRLRPILPGGEAEGFVFTSLDIGNKIVHVRLFGSQDIKEFAFSIAVPGLNADYLRHDFENRFLPNQLIDCDTGKLLELLTHAPRATSNGKGLRAGDPVNLVVIGEFPMLISAFGARWDETETITFATCWKTFKAFFMGTEYRYSPVSPLFLEGRSQDFALQRIRQSINERLHLRLWLTPWRYEGMPVWIGQVSRDIGVRFTWRTWNLTTHRIDPDVDEARDYVVEDLLQAERLEQAGYVDGVGECDRKAPRCNLTGDPYFTDGKRAAIVISKSRTTPKFMAWS